MVRPAPRSPEDGAATSNKQNFLDTPTCFTRTNSISDIPCGPIFTLGRITFTTPIFFDGRTLDNGDTVLDGAARLVPVFALFAAGFFDT
jgi:hypothetical protein